MKKNKLSIILIVLLCMNMLFINNFSYIYLSNRSVTFHIVYLLMIFISWMPFLLTIVIIIGYAPLMYNRKYKKSWKYVYINIILLILNILFLLSLNRFKIYENNILNTLIFVLCLFVALGDLAIIAIKRKFHFNLESELGNIEKVRDRKKRLAKDNKNNSLVCAYFLILISILNVSSIFFTICVTFVCVYLGIMICKNKYCDYKIYIGDRRFLKCRLITSHYLFFIISCLLYGKVSEIYIVFMLMMSNLYVSYLDNRLLRAIYKDEFPESLTLKQLI